MKKIYQVKYNSGHYAYYKSLSKDFITDKVKFYASYTDCRDEVNPINEFEQIKLRESLQKHFK